MNNKGLFITFEGLDGSGKTLMTSMLAARLKSEGYDVLETREPGGSPLGTRLRKVLLSSAAGSVGDEAEALLFAADRAQHCRQIIAPALSAGRIVVCDRFSESTLAYQGGGRGLDMEMLRALNQFTTGGLTPDCTFYLRLPLAETLKRRSTSMDRLEQAGLEFFQRAEAVYEQIAQSGQANFCVIDASANPEKVFAAIWAKVQQLLRQQ